MLKQPKSLHIQTPVLRSHKLCNLNGKQIYLKMECYQPVGSFKIRGIGRLCQSYVEDGVRQLITSSGGNAGYAVAYAGRLLNAKVQIIVPETTSEVAKDVMRAEGASVEICGKSWDDAHSQALRLAESGTCAYIHPFDDPLLWTGHSSIIDECVTQCKPPDAIVVSVGGGGLLCGIMEGLHRHAAWRDVPVIAVETKGAESLHKSIKENRLIKLERIDSIAVTLGARQVAPKAFEWGLTSQVKSILVSDQQAIDACKRFVDDHRVVVEPSCGAALAALYNSLDIIHNAKSILVIVCGGIGVNLELLEKWGKYLSNSNRIS